MVAFLGCSAGSPTGMAQRSRGPEPQYRAAATRGKARWLGVYPTAPGPTPLGLQATLRQVTAPTRNSGLQPKSRPGVIATMSFLLHVSQEGSPCKRGPRSYFASFFSSF